MAAKTLAAGKAVSIMLEIVHMTVNGEEKELAVDPRESLLDTLRNRLNLTSVKRGCGVGECGACTVLIDGTAVDSCLYLTMWAEGKHILTVEGLKSPTGELNEVQQAFIDEATAGENTHGKSFASSYPGTSAAVQDMRIS